MFFVIMDFLKTSFFYIMDPICIHVLEVALQGIKCEGEIIINLPSSNKWANEIN
jgi:hypothetical protein